MIPATQPLSTAPTFDLLESYAEAKESARKFAEQGYPQTSADFRAVAEMIAAEIVGRCVR